MYVETNQQEKFILVKSSFVKYIIIVTIIVFR